MPESNTPRSDLKGLVLATVNKLRAKLLDLTMANRLLNFKPSDKSRSHVRIIDEVPEALFEKLESGKELEFTWIDEPELEPPDEATDEFRRALKVAKADDSDYLDQLEKLGKRASRRQLSSVERGLRDRIRESLAMSASVKASVADRARELGLDPSYDLPGDSAHRSRSHADSKIQTLLYREGMEAKLSAIRESDKTLLDDAGVNALYAAFGAVEWYEAADSNIPVFAPLLFVPVEIRRVLDDGVYRFVLVMRDDDIENNQAFGELIKEAYSLEMPGWNSERSLSDYLADVERVLASQKRWRLRRWVTVGLFTFAKMSMYRDLDTRRWAAQGGLEAHPVLNDLLAGTEVTSEVLLAADYEIDAPAMAAKVQTLVTDADSSQHSAVIDVSDGKNLVIQGPPGTGKSQTITNIIATAMSNGKRVLFVAEKMAALKVVKDRLDSFGLGQFCLEVHSNKTRKTVVLKSFEDRMNLSSPAGDVRQLRQAVESFEQARAELIHYVQKMKEEVGETGMNVHEMLRANCIRIPIGEGLPAGIRKIRVPEPMQVDCEKRSVVMDLAKSLQLSAATVDHWGGLAKHPWRGVEDQDLDVFESQDLAEELRSWRETLAALGKTVAEISRAEGWLFEATANEAEKFVVAVLAPPEMAEGVSEVVLHEGGTEQGVAVLTLAVQSLMELTEAQRKLESTFDASGVLETIPVAAVVSAGAKAHELGLDAVKVRALPEVLRVRKETSWQLKKSLGAVAQFAELFGVGDPKVSDVSEIVRATGLLLEIPLNVLDLREPCVMQESNSKALDRGAKRTEVLRQLKSTSSMDFRFVSLPGAGELREAADILRNSSFLARVFGSKYRNAKRLYDGIAQPNAGRRKRNPGEETARLVQFLDQKTELENDAELRAAAGISFRGMETRWQDLLNLSRWSSKIRAELSSVEGELSIYGTLLLTDEIPKLRKVIALAKQDGLIGELRGFRGFEQSSDRSIQALSESAENEASRTEDFVREVQKLGVNGSLALGELPLIAAKISRLRAAEEKLREPEIWRIVELLPKSHGVCLETLKTTLTFLEKLAAVQMPPAARRRILDGPSRERLESLRTGAGAVTEGLNACANHKRAVVSLAKLNPQDWIGRENVDDARVEDLGRRIEFALSNRQALQPYLEFLRIEQKARIGPLEALLKHLESTSPPYSGLAEGYDFIFFRSCAEAILSADPMLRSHSGVTHEQLRKRYQELDRKIMQLRRVEIAQRLANVSIPPGNGRGRTSEITELALIHKQIGLQRRHVALRDLFKRAGAAAQSLKPCFMMSPMSVSQFLDPDGIRFDLVVMDEASQIRPEDSLGAIVRGKQLVVVGDPKQLPPTSFFERVDRDDSANDDTEEADIHDMTSQESILDLARGPYQPVRQLRWHYRSQHEKLIAFSNQEFYDNTLIVFPSPRGDDADYGVRLVAVDGVYEAGLNRSEAEAVAEAAQTFMKRFPRRSLGIVAMNKAQQEQIQRLMDELFASDVDAESYRLRWENTLEPVFVKNLENVQGDERDVIFISTVYGKDAAGNFFQRLGPINGAHGHRRLNVLFTRAKQQVCLFTSMRASDLRVEATTRWGVKALKNYLAYAQTGHLNTEQLTGREPDSEFERWVMEMLKEAGYETVPQLGVAGYYIDLAVRHPAKNGSFILGIECDGAMYHSARSVRDRDRLRQEVLERLQWSIYRIWSTDWFRNPRAEFQKLTATLAALRVSDTRRG